MAKGKNVQNPVANGPIIPVVIAQGTTTEGGLHLQTPEERHESMVDWCRAEMAHMGYCTAEGEPTNPMHLDIVRTKLHKIRPMDAQEITEALKEITEDMVSRIFQRFPIQRNGRFFNIHVPSKALQYLRLDLPTKRANAILAKWEIQNGPRHYATSVSQANSNTEPVLISKSVRAAETRDTTPIEQNAPSHSSTSPNANQDSNTDEVLESWIYHQFLDYGFSDKGFKGWAKLTKNMVFIKGDLKKDIIHTVAKLRESGHKYSFGDPDVIASQKQEMVRQKNREGHVQHIPPSEPSSSRPTAAKSLALLKNSPATPATIVTPSISGAKKPMNTVPLSTKLNGFHIAEQAQVPSNDSFTNTESDQEGYEYTDNNYSDVKVQVHPSEELPYQPDYDHIDLLMSDDNFQDNPNEKRTGTDSEIQHAPLVSGSLLTDENRNLLPQYGFLGVARDRCKIFLNTNIPFSAFICGVQGSGKSHTTSCLLENVLIPSKHLGRLENPLSALVFSYGHFTGDGSGFNISEVASLAAAHPSFPGHSHVKKITVLVSPSNPGIARLYRKVQNVTVIPYKLKPQNLDIDIMLTLMAVNESDVQPLYMAQVTQILRDMATNGDGRLNYALFKQRLEECNFNPAQSNMLQLRMDLLESFLDLEGTCPEPSFAPGEITIMDMSCPFVDANTACIMFKIGLQRYLQSEAPGKMIVLDEAHKYMLKNPGAIALNSYLLQVIRLQRHFGARVIISTQEPTLLADLIALCSITVIHRFSSPEWFSALKKHIPMLDQDHTKLLRLIEGLKTGAALVYSSGAVLGKNEDGTLLKGTGKMIRVGIRKRVTSDGGQSVLAV